MKLWGKIFLALLLCAFIGQAEAASEWVQLVTDDSEGYVLDVNGNTFIIDAGRTSGARKGALYLVYADGKQIYDVNGVFIGSYKIPLAVLKVRDVSTSYSLCVAAPPRQAWIVQRGDKIAPISASKAKRIKFAADRVLVGPAVVEAVPMAAASVPLPVAQEPPRAAVQYEDYWANVVPGAVAVAPRYYYSESPAIAPYVMGTVRASASAPSPTSVPQSRPTGAAQQQQALPSLTPAAAQQAPVFQTEPPFPPFPPSPINNTVMLDFDANLIADARLIRTFPLSQVEMNALEIEHRGAWNLYSSQRYMEAFESFSRSSSYRGNYLSPYWAGMSALKLRNIQSATAWFNRALEINPYFQPARNAKLNAAQYIAQSSQPQPKAQPAKKPVRRAPRKRR